MILNIIGLSLDLIGVLLLFRFGILPNNLWEHILMDSGMSEKDEKRHKMWSKIAVTIIFIGFSLQLGGTVLQYQSGKKNSKTSQLTIDLGSEKNITSGLNANLKLKFDNNELYYQMEIAGKNEQVSKVTKFWIFLEDADGFKIAEISENNEPENQNTTRHFYQDSITMNIKNKIPMDRSTFDNVEKWEFKISKD